MKTSRPGSVALKWWRRCLRRAGLPEHWRPDHIGPHELESLAHLRETDPELYADFVEASRLRQARIHRRPGR